MINQIIGTFLPSIIALKIHNKIEQTEESLKKQVERYLLYVMFVNITAYAVTIYLFKQPYIVFTYLFTVKYVLVSLIIAVIIPVLERLIISNLGLEIKVEKNEEEN